MIRFEVSNKVLDNWKRTAVVVPDATSPQMVRMKTGEVAANYASRAGIPYPDIKARAVNDRGQVLFVDE